MQNQSNCAITFDGQLKTALITALKLVFCDNLPTTKLKKRHRFRDVNEKARDTQPGISLEKRLEWHCTFFPYLLASLKETGEN